MRIFLGVARRLGTLGFSTGLLEVPLHAIVVALDVDEGVLGCLCVAMWLRPLGVSTGLLEVPPYATAGFALDTDESVEA